MNHLKTMAGKKRSAQSIAEYILILAAVAAGIIAVFGIAAFNPQGSTGAKIGLISSGVYGQAGYKPSAVENFLEKIRLGKVDAGQPVDTTTDLPHLPGVSK